MKKEKKNPTGSSSISSSSSSSIKGKKNPSGNVSSTSKKKNSSNGNSNSNSNSNSKNNKKTNKKKNKSDKNYDDNNDDDDNDDEVKPLSPDTIRFLEMLAMRLPHKSPSSSSSLQLMMAACDAIQGTAVASEIASNPKHCLKVFEDAFAKKEDNNDSNNSATVDENIKILINTNSISQLLSNTTSYNDTNSISIDSLINTVSSSSFQHHQQQLVHRMITYYSNASSSSNSDEQKFVSILRAKILSSLVFSSNTTDDTNSDNIETECCMWAYVTIMSIASSSSTGTSTPTLQKIISTLHLLAIDNPVGIFMSIGYLGYWGIRLNRDDYDDDDMILLIQAISSLLNANLQSIHINGSNDPNIDMEILILGPVLLYCWLSKLKGSSNTLRGLKDLLINYVTVVAQTTANTWTTLLAVLKDTDKIKIDKDVTNRGYEIGKKGLTELLNWFCSKAGLLDSACLAMAEGVISTSETTTSKNNKKGQEKKGIQILKGKDNDDNNPDDDDDNNDDDEPLSFTLDNTRDDSILKSLENEEDYKGEEPNEMEQELNSTNKKKKNIGNDDKGNAKKKIKVK